MSLGPTASGPLPAEGRASAMRSALPSLTRVTAPVGPKQKPASPMGQVSPAWPASADRMSASNHSVTPRSASVLARASITSSMAIVRRPVKVFCWLGW